jgi:hypothetical protein
VVCSLISYALSVHLLMSIEYFCKLMIDDYLVQFWVQLLPLKVRQWVHFPHPFLEYVFNYCALTVSRAKICSTYLFLGALFAPTFYH